MLLAAEGPAELAPPSESARHVRGLPDLGWSPWLSFLSLDLRFDRYVRWFRPSALGGPVHGLRNAVEVPVSAQATHTSQ